MSKYIIFYQCLKTQSDSHGMSRTASNHFKLRNDNEMTIALAISYNEKSFLISLKGLLPNHAFVIVHILIYLVKN